MADAATDLANIGSMIGSANSAVAAATTGVLPPPPEGFSAQTPALFSSHAAGYQKLSAQAAAFHEQFVKALTSGAGTYAAAEADVAQSLVAAAPTLGLNLSTGLAGVGARVANDLAGFGGSV